MTTFQALQQILRCHVVIIRNTANAVNSFVTNRSWLAISSVALVCILVSVVNIMQARAERDAAMKKQFKLQQQIEQLTLAVEVERSAR